MRQRIIASIVISLIAGPASAALLGRSALTPGGTDYQAYYDDVQNITWLRNANLPRSMSFGVEGICQGNDPMGSGCPENPGAMDWSTANDWIAAMNGASYLGTTDWRMPQTVQPDPGCDGRTNPYPAPRQNYGFGCTLSEMPHLHSDGITWYRPGPFINMAAPEDVWSETSYAINTTYAWTFNFYAVGGFQYAVPKGYKEFVWPVLDGDPFAVVPIPAAAWLFGGALGLLGAARRRIV
ncbi:MAG: DUF1566 domain-containing protein [Gammaproteobacteria bacterium]